MEAKPFVLPTALLIAVITALVFLASGCTVSETVTSIDDLPNELSNALSSFQEVNCPYFPRHFSFSEK